MAQLPDRQLSGKSLKFVLYTDSMLAHFLRRRHRQTTDPTRA